jgi:hypothetical protein
MKPPILPTETAETMKTEFVQFGYIDPRRHLAGSGCAGRAKRSVRAILDPVSHSIRAKFASSQGASVEERLIQSLRGQQFDLSTFLTTVAP